MLIYFPRSRPPLLCNSRYARQHLLSYHGWDAGSGWIIHLQAPTGHTPHCPSQVKEVPNFQRLHRKWQERLEKVALCHCSTIPWVYNLCVWFSHGRKNRPTERIHRYEQTSETVFSMEPSTLLLLRLKHLHSRQLGSSVLRNVMTSHTVQRTSHHPLCVGREGRIWMVRLRSIQVP